MPDNIRVICQGSIPHNDVLDEMGKHDLFFLPTHGENYGHVIMEALSAGCPVLISDQTPWRDLETKGVGWDIPLNRPEEFVRILQECVTLSGDAHSMVSHRAYQFAKEFSMNSTVVDCNRELFSRALTSIE